jgi:hypothetical protein
LRILVQNMFVGGSCFQVALCSFRDKGSTAIDKKKK